MSDKPTSTQKGHLLQTLCRGLQHVPVLCVNPDFESGEESDRWYIQFPIPLSDNEETLITVKTDFMGFTSKQQLAQIVQLLFLQPERALSLKERIPSISDPSKAKTIALLVPMF